MRVLIRQIPKLLFVGLLWLTAIASAKAQFTITEDFRGGSVGSDIVLGGTPNVAYLTSGVADPGK